MKHLLIFTITPVQSFIAQSRKVRDLAAGSQLLSSLVDEAIIFLKSKKNLVDTSIIFPFKDLKNKPNRLLVYVKTDKPKKLGKDLEEHIQETFISNAQKSLAKYYKKNSNFNCAMAQLKDLIKSYWVIIPITDNYSHDYKKIESLLGGTKNLRVFNQFAEKGRKCAINGEYNVTIFRGSEEKNTPHWLSYTNNVTKIKKRDGLELKKLAYEEGLSTINFYKRIYKLENKSKFSATCDIANLDAIKIISDDEKVSKALVELRKLDEQYVYDDTPIRKEDKDKKSEIFQNRKIVKTACKKHKVKLQKYYAILVFDADKMGKWLSGEYLQNKEKDLLDFQKKLSKLFGDFAEYAQEYVSGKGDDKIEKGQTVYAGGDDYLGLINLKYLFDVLENLNSKFKQMIWEVLGSDDSLKFIDATEPMTFSAGVAIAHYKTPLSFVLQEARKAEKRAKEKAGRKAISLTVLKRSGEIHQSFFKWCEDKKYLPDSFSAIIEALNRKTSSNKFITSFTEEFLPITEEDNTDIDRELVETELKRLIEDNKDPGIESKVIELYNHFYSNGRRLKDFIYLLNIADFISREINSLYKTKKNELCQ